MKNIIIKKIPDKKIEGLFTIIFEKDGQEIKLITLLQERINKLLNIAIHN